LIDIKILQKYFDEDKIFMTEHAAERFHQREIRISDIRHAVNFGEIVEQYPEDFPFPSCLILGLTIKGQYIHIVVSMNETKIYLITAYVPDPAKWGSDLKTHKEAKK